MDRQIKGKRKPTKIEDMTKEQITQAIQRKRECNAKAQAIVESLIEKAVSEIYFLDCLKDINQNHFEDVIEERSISHLCGYPVCPNIISEKDIPKQKYRISLKTNKIYDITIRKNFCSNTCYKAAMYIKKQMLTSPLWFREYEEIPKFAFLPLETIGSLGQEIDVSIVEKLEITSDKRQPFTTVNEFASMSLQELSCQEEKENIGEDMTFRKSTIDRADEFDHNKRKNDFDTKLELQSPNKGCIYNKSNTLESIQEHVNVEQLENDLVHSTKNVSPQLNDKSAIKKVEIENVKNPIAEKNIEMITPDSKEKGKCVKSTVNPLNIVGDIIERPEKKIDPILTDIPHENKKSEVKISPTNRKVSTRKELGISVLTTQVETSLANWFTFDSIFYLLGEEKVREQIVDKTDAIKKYINNYSKSVFYNSNTYDQYQQLVRRLSLLEIEDKKFDLETLKQKETKPLPDYSMLKEESKKMQLKVRAFLAGDTDIPVEHSVEVQNHNENVDSSLTQLPIIDKNAQNAHRRRIVCQHLNKVLPDLLRSLGLLTLTISSDVRLLVNTFKLRADNIMFKPVQWTLIAIVILKLLSLRNPQLDYLLRQQMAYQHLQLLLLSYKQDGGYLDRLVIWLTDMNRILEVNNSEQIT